jgi:3-polyprenyl-4-hydroxybenzoate decarboxylase
MKIEQVPQEQSMLEGERRACYAEDSHGRYVVVPSTGWEVEKIVNAQAVAEVRAAIDAAHTLVLQGRRSPLAYHMARCQMTPALLAANAGVARPRVWWHLRPKGFARLRSAVLARYAEALAISVEELHRFPAPPPGDTP